MGCGISRFNLDGDGNGCGFRPIRRRLDEMRRSSHAITDGNHSTKMLLKDRGEEYALVDSNDGRKSVSSNSPKSMVMIKDPIAGEGGEKKCYGARKKDDEEEDDDDEEEEDDDDDDGGRISNVDAPLFMGSPSFRMYCIDCDSDDDCAVKDDYDGNGVGGQRKETKVKDCNASLTSTQGRPKLPKGKKWRRGRKFRKVFPMGKNLLNVSTCCSPAPGGAHAHEGLQKPAAKVVT